MKLIPFITCLLLLTQLNAQDSTATIKTGKKVTMSNRPDTFNAKKELKELRTLIEKLPVAIATEGEKKETDLFNVIAIIGQVLGFLILLCSWYFQNQRQADWEDKKDKLRQVWGVTTTLETQLDVLEFANNSLSLDSGTQRATHVAYSGARLHYLNDFGWQIWAYLKNSSKMYKMDTTSTTAEQRAEIDLLIEDGKAKLTQFENSFNQLEQYVWFFRDEQRRATSSMAEVIYKYRDKIDIEIGKANTKANFLYVVGSIVLLIGFSLPAKKDLPDMSWFAFTLCFVGIFGVFFLLFKLITAK